MVAAGTRASAVSPAREDFPSPWADHRCCGKHSLAPFQAGAGHGARNLLILMTVPKTPEIPIETSEGRCSKGK